MNQKERETLKTGNYTGIGPQYHPSTLPMWTWVTDYADMGPCLELMAAQGRLKKNENFTKFAVDVAQQILGDQWTVTYGKWGARLEADLHLKKSRAQFEAAAEAVRCHPSWIGLSLAAQIF